MELKALLNSLKVDELKAEVTKGNMELRAMITDLINGKYLFVSLHSFLNVSQGNRPLIKM